MLTSFEKRRFSRSIPLGYLVISALWIVFSDTVIALFADTPAAMRRLQTWKGLFFVVFTALLLFLVLHRLERALRKGIASLRASRAEVDGLVSSAMDAIITIDDAQRIVEFNPAAEAMFCYQRGEAIGMELGRLVPERYRARHGSLVSEYSAGGDTRRAMGRLMPLTGLRSNGEEFPMEATISRHTAGSRRYGTAIVRDVTERVAAEREREELVARLGTVMDATSDGIILVDADGRCLVASRAVSSILGSTEEEILGRNLHELIHSHLEHVITRRPCPIEAGLQGKAVSVRGEECSRADGTKIFIDLSAVPLMADARFTGAVVTMRDVTSERVLSEQLGEVQRVESLGKLSAAMTHEFKNVLMAIGSFNEVVGRIAGDDPKVADAVAAIAHSVERGRTLTNTIRDFSKSPPPDFAIVEAASFVERLLPQLQALMPPGVALEADIGDEIGALRADVSQLEQVFTNLVINAREAADETGQVRLRAWRHPSPACSSFPLSVGSNFLHFDLVDDGSGMSASVLEHAIEPMFTTKKWGTGLGLAVVNRIVALHGGFLNIESRAGEGTTVHVLLPAV